ncbi:glycosyltransferase [Streptomyces inhibens]|uniref:glycosyltransferase n=1 Tax=Streptomyces inhibens TaxID=2293571 RepID=UPI00402A82DC
MTRVLLATIPITGHVRPALPVAKRLVADGNEVVWYTGKKFEDLVGRTGARFVASSAQLDFDDSRVDVLQSMDDRKPGLAGLKKTIRKLFVESIPGYARDVAPLVDDFRPHVIVADHCFMAAPFLAQLRGIPKVVFGVGPLSVSSVDTAPFGMGLRPSATPLGRLRNRSLQWLMSHVVFHDIQRAAHRVNAEVGIPPLDGFFMDWGMRVADRYLLATIPEFEYPRSDVPDAIEFVGPMLPVGVDDWEPPEWWPELTEARRDGRPVVLVTQGTATSDPAHLVLPAIAGLADKDALVIATTDKADPDRVLPVAQRPKNLQLVSFVPFIELLPHTDVVVTNGGYGGVQMALAYGVPLVTAGLSEDKMEVNTRVEWSGTGVSLNTWRPGPAKIRAGVDKVLGDPGYRTRAQQLGAAYARYSGAERAAEVILESAAAPR